MKESNYNRIQDFLAKKMTSDEFKKFDQDLGKDNSLAEDLAMELAVRKAAEKNRLEEIQAKFKSYESQPSGKISSMILRVAAVLILLAGAFGIYKLMNQTSDFLTKDDKMALFEIVDKAEMNLTTAGSSNDGRSAFRNKNFLLALENFQDFLEGKKSEGAEPCDYIEYNYYIGVIQLFRTNEYESAIQYLECASSEKINGQNYNNEIPYLLTIANIRAGKINKAKALMTKYNIKTSDLFEIDSNYLK